MLIDFLLDNLLFVIMFAVVIIGLVVGFILFNRPDNVVVEETKKQEAKHETLKPKKQTSDTEENMALDDELKEMPTIITHFAETHAEEDASDEISSNLNEDAEGEIKSVKAYLVNDDRKPILDDSVIHSNRFVTKPKRTEEEEFAFLYEEDDDHDTEKNSNKRYHVLYLKEENNWFVKREGNERVIKIFETQKEAIAFATIKALENETSVVVHRRDGKIRKYSL